MTRERLELILKHIVGSEAEVFVAIGQDLQKRVLKSQGDVPEDERVTVFEVATTLLSLWAASITAGGEVCELPELLVAMHTAVPQVVANREAQKTAKGKGAAAS